jgi:hypothetical protein
VCDDVVFVNGCLNIFWQGRKVLIGVHTVRDTLSSTGARLNIYPRDVGWLLEDKQVYSPTFVKVCRE